MFERFSDNARAAVIQAQDHARELGHRYIGCEHLLLAVASTGEPASAVLREQGVTPEAVTTEIVRFVGRAPGAELFDAADHNALASIGIDLDAVRARIEEVFGTRRLHAGHARCMPPPPARVAEKSSPAQLLRRRRRSRAGRAVAVPQGAGAHPAGHIPFTPRARKSLERSWREAKARHDTHIGVEHLTLALVAMTDGAVPPIWPRSAHRNWPCVPPSSTATGRPADPPTTGAPTQIIPICASHLITGIEPMSAPNGGSTRVLLALVCHSG